MRTRVYRSVVLLAASTLVAAACSSPPTSDGDGDGDGGGGRLVDVTDRLNEIYTELEGLDAEARRERLIELADEEGGSVDAYGSTNLDDIFPMIDAFEDETGIDVNYYRASSSDILERVLQEADADFPGADLVFTNGPELTVIDREGLLAPLESPTTEEIDDQGVFDTWAWLYLNTFVGSWNTDRVQQPPATWEELLAHGDGLAVEVGDFDWFATLVKNYFVAEQGMTEEEAIDLFREAADGAALVDGHTLMAELLAAGEYDVASSTYLHRILQLKKDDAPVEWEGGPQPIIIRPNGIGIHRYADEPASALLFLEFMLTDAQSLLLEIDRQPASAGVSGGGIPTGAETMVVDLAALLEERDKWEGLWDEIIEGSEGQTYEG
ncbi:MAG TPA: ABC transporter substrate-binding protein [Actinomycetota bacterium]|nr:ABC transporter substrate-binding protein [Actinomycetota bacterium]